MAHVQYPKYPDSVMHFMRVHLCWKNSFPPGIAPTNQPRYQPAQDCTYWTLLGFFYNCNIITFYNKNTTSEDF